MVAIKGILKATMTTFTKRLKEARQRAGLSQEQLGIDAGLEPASASTRMNRYELGKRFPDLELIERLAATLRVPVPYLFAKEQECAELLLGFDRLSKSDKAAVLSLVSDLVSKKKG